MVSKTIGWGFESLRPCQKNLKKIMKNPFTKVRIFYKETVAELKKASWPTWKEILSYMKIVFVSIALVGIFVGIADFAIYNVMDVIRILVTKN